MRDIKEVFVEDAEVIAHLIREANKPVAKEFGITPDNCPKHPSCCEKRWVEADFKRGERYFMLTENTLPVACVAYETKTMASEKAGANKAYLNRLSVLPEHQNKGLGLALAQYIIELARLDAINMISMGIIAKHSKLLNWYEKMGFIQCGTKHFEHLPFSVTYMNYTLRN
ncbi:MAG: GNAT family N-acetyltransferase [Marinomonas sp.]